MALDFGILQPANISSQMMAGQQQAQQNQLAQQQLKQSQMQTQQSTMQMEQLQRDRDALAKLQQQFVANGKSPDLEENFSAMIQSGIPHFVDIGTQGLQKIQQQKQFATIVGSGATSSATPTAPVNALAPTAEGVAPAASVNALAPTSNVQAQIAAAYQLGTPAALAWAKAQEDRMKPVTGAAGGFVYNPQTQSFMQAPEKTPAPAAPPSMVAEYQFAKTPDGGGYVGSYEKFVRDRAVAARPPGAPTQPSAPVAVVDPVTGKPMYVSREKAMGMAPASAQESLPPKEIQKREAVLPQATSAIQGFESKSDKFIADLKALRDDPGLENITGAIYGRTGSVTREGSRAQALYDKVVAKGGFQALQDLRDASKTGGALGNVSNTEGSQLKASFAAIDRRQSAEDVRAAIDQAIADIEGSKARMREAYDQTYSYKAAAPGATPTAPNIDALLNKYK